MLLCTLRFTRLRLVRSHQRLFVASQRNDARGFSARKWDSSAAALLPERFGQRQSRGSEAAAAFAGCE